MKELINKILSSVYRFSQVRKWRREARFEANFIKSDPGIKQQFGGCCLILIPHSDDEWIGCSRIIASTNEVVLCNMDMKGGDSPQMHKDRFEELSRVANEYGRRLITIKENKAVELKNIIREIKPNYVFIPHYIDWHPEHVEVMKILYSAIANEEQMNFCVVMYQVSCPIVNGITHALPMTKQQWEQKWAFFKSHYRTQLKIPYPRFSLNEVINGVCINSKAAEVFCEENATNWMMIIRTKLPNEQQVVRLKERLGSISEMRHYIKKEIIVR